MARPKVLSYCNTCRGEKNHEVLKQVTQDHSSITPSGAERRWSSTFKMLECCGCGDVHLRVEYWDEYRDLDENDFKYYPPRRLRVIPVWARELPDDWYSLMQEVYEALAANSRRLAVMGARTLVDLYLTETIGANGTFDQRLDRLVANGYLAMKAKAPLAAALDAGSAAAHRGHTPSHRDLESVMDIVESLLQTHVLEGTAATLKANTPARPQKKP